VWRVNIKALPPEHYPLLVAVVRLLVWGLFARPDATVPPVTLIDAEDEAALRAAMSSFEAQPALIESKSLQTAYAGFLRLHPIVRPTIVASYVYTRDAEPRADVGS